MTDISESDTRRLCFDLRTSTAPKGTAGTASSTPLDWPFAAHDEETEIVMRLSLDEYVALASCVDVGSDIAYSSDALRVWWIWTKAFLGENMIKDCNDVIDCMADINATQDGRLTALEGDSAAQATQIGINSAAIAVLQAEMLAATGAIGVLQTEVAAAALAITGILAGQGVQDLRLTALEGSDSAQNGRLDTLESDVIDLENAVDDLETIDIPIINSRLDSLEGNVSGNALDIANLQALLAPLGLWAHEFDFSGSATNGFTINNGTATGFGILQDSGGLISLQRVESAPTTDILLARFTMRTLSGGTPVSNGQVSMSGEPSQLFIGAVAGGTRDVVWRNTNSDGIVTGTLIDVDTNTTSPDTTLEKILIIGTGQNPY